MASDGDRAPRPSAEGAAGGMLNPGPPAAKAGADRGSVCKLLLLLPFHATLCNCQTASCCTAVGPSRGTDQPAVEASEGLGTHRQGYTPRLDWRGGQPVLRFGCGYSLLNRIALQAVYLCSRTTGMYQCAACGVLYSPQRRGRPGERRLCGKCRKAGERQRFADVARRARNRSVSNA